MTMTQRLPIYFIIIALVLAFAWWGTPKTTVPMGGIFLPATDKTFAPITQGSIQITQDNAAGTPVGQVNLQMYSKKVDQNTIEQFQKFASQFTAEHGGNMLVIKQFGQAQGENTVILQGIAFQS